MYGAIKLKKSSNGTIMDNNCSLNFAAGIFLEENCKNNTIVNNTLFNNIGPGISLTSGSGDGCQNNNISGNTICHNKEPCPNGRKNVRRFTKEQSTSHT